MFQDDANCDSWTAFLDGNFFMNDLKAKNGFYVTKWLKIKRQIFLDMQKL